MSETVISVEGLGKRYRVGQREAYGTLRDSLARMANPARWIRRGDGVARSDERDFWALRDVSFEVKRGEVLGIIGRNGAGKSTLLKILSRITRPTTGWAEVRGRVASLLEVGTGFHAELTGRENVFLNGAILGMPKAEITRKFDEIVAFAEVERFIDTPVKRYSSGMYLRLAFAVAAFLEPEILIVDEVLAVGDQAFQKKCLGQMESVAGGGRTVLFVSHNMAAVRTLCQRTLWIDRGSKKSEGDTDGVVAEYVGSVEMGQRNAVDVRSAGRHGELGVAVRLESLVFNGGLTVQHGERLDIDVTFCALQDIRDAVVGVGINTTDDVRVLSVDSDNDGLPIKLRSGERMKASVRLGHFDLAPGRYLLDCGIRGSDGRLHDAVSHAAILLVESGPTTSPLFARFGGGMRPVTHWRFEEVGKGSSFSSSDPTPESEVG